MAHNPSFGLPLAVLFLASFGAFVSRPASGQATGTGAATVTLAVSPTEANSTYNPSATVTLTATVLSGNGGVTPTGSVTFYNTSTSADVSSTPSALNAGGTASLTIEGVFSLGGNGIEAIYSGDGSYASATSTPPVNVNIQPSTTSLAVVPSANSVSPGTTITVTATVSVGSPPEGSVAPNGNVTLNLDGLPTTTASLTTASGVTTATFSLPIPASTLTTHALQAVYAGNADYAAATSPAVTVTVAKSATTTTVTAIPSTLTVGATETLSATVAPVSSVSGAPAITGTVSFYDGGTTLLGTASVASGGGANLIGVALANNVSHSITAIYSGDVAWLASTSPALLLAATTLPDVVVLTSNLATLPPGQALVLTVTVTPTVTPILGAEQNPTGNVVFYDGTIVIGTAPLTAAPVGDSSTATLTTETLPGGQDVLSAFYEGDLYYDTATSNLLTLDIQDFTITPAAANPATNLNIVQGSSGSAGFVITGLGGFNGAIQVVCAAPAQDDMTCTATPQQLTPPGTVSFVIQTFSPGEQGVAAAASYGNAPIWPCAGGGAALAVLGFFLLPLRRRARVLAGRNTRRRWIFLLLLAGLGGAGIGCSSVRGVNGTGTPLGVATLKITASAYVDNAVVSHSVYLTVNVMAPVSTQ